MTPNGSPLNFHGCPYCGALVVMQRHPNGDGGRILHRDTPCEGFKKKMAEVGMRAERPAPGEAFVAIAGDPEGLARTLPIRLVRPTPP